MAVILTVLAFMLTMAATSPANSQVVHYRTLAVTPDLSVGSDATASFTLEPYAGSGVDHIAIKNDCTTSMHFNLSGDGDTYPIKLNGGESFSGPFKVYTVRVSNDTTAACTFTLQPSVIGR